MNTLKKALLRAMLLLPIALSLAAMSATGCAKKKESIVTIGGDKKLTAEEIDKDPLALLPGGMVAIVQADVQSFLQSSLGPSALKIAQNLVPLTAEMNFQPERDLKTLIAGLYSMSGADMAAIAQGSFDVEAIKRAANRGAITAMGQPLRRVDYANNDLYLSGDLGFVLLTPKTALIGNPAGMRRALDRIRDGRVKREVPDWMLELLKTPNAQAVLAADLQGQAVPAAAIAQAPFLNGMRQARVIGNFQPPGMNVAGTITYPDPTAAANSEAQVKQLAQMAGMLNFLSFLGVSSPLRGLETKVGGNDLQFLAAVDGAATAALLNQLGVVTYFGSMVSPQR